VDDRRWERFLRKTSALEAIQELLRSRKAAPSSESAGALGPHAGESLAQALRDPAVRREDIEPCAPELAAYPAEWVERVLLDTRYEGYIEKERRQAAKSAKLDAMKLDPDLDYAALSGLSAEAREKLAALRPLTVGQAARIPGLRQGDIALLMVLIHR
ncbi:MAG: tRNA uridine-5-carboxymethylaminomethyl(34) synthesis enzyme MnmG, partial [Spirochaetaceae bacterium]|jgi:tRNA uridine 5-carboxymethylaminomethyl modification enzyme|nr:tRNA uridine-5-carboxymethylaminomethyl(34) synthesis enzyme MnmG [Spirochaetaceae bacterium]